MLVVDLVVPVCDGVTIGDSTVIVSVDPLVVAMAEGASVIVEFFNAIEDFTNGDSVTVVVSNS